jgi:hypothetical protein
MTTKAVKELGSWSAYWDQFPMGELNGESAPVDHRETVTTVDHRETVTTVDHRDCGPMRVLYVNARPAPGQHARRKRVGILCGCGQAIIDRAT